MNILRPFTTDFWVDYDPNCLKYEHTPNVVPFPGPHARANAAQAAMLLEDDRAATRRDTLRRDLMRQRRELEERIEQIDAAIVELC